MAPVTADDQVQFLLSCIKHSTNGKVNFTEVAKECNIITSGAAAKRYERLRKSSTPGPNKATTPTKTAGESSSPEKKTPKGNKRKSPATTTPSETPSKRSKTVKEAVVDSAEKMVGLKFEPREDEESDLSKTDDFSEFFNDEASTGVL